MGLTVIGSNVDLTGIVSLAAADTVHHKAGSVTNGALAVSGIVDYAHDFGIDSDATPTSQTKWLLPVRGTGTIKYVYASLKDTGSSTNINFDLLKDGTTTMSGGRINMTNSDADYDHKAGTLTTTAIAANDSLTVDLAVTSSTGAQGPAIVVGILWDATKS